VLANAFLQRFAAFCCGCYVVWLLNCPALFVSRTVAENRMLAAANFKL